MFHPKKGYGFVSITDGPYEGASIFVHHSAIQVKRAHRRYLVEGERVSFQLVPSEDGEHEFVASQVTGVPGEKLMCESKTNTSTSAMSAMSATSATATTTAITKEANGMDVVENNHGNQPWRLVTKKRMN